MRIGPSPEAEPRASKTAARCPRATRSSSGANADPSAHAVDHYLGPLIIPCRRGDELVLGEIARARGDLDPLRQERRAISTIKPGSRNHLGVRHCTLLCDKI